MKSPARAVRWLVPALALFAFMGAATSAEEPDDFAAAKKKYDESLKIESLWWRVQGMYAMFQTLDPRGVDVLTQRYQKAEKPTAQLKYLAAGMMGDYGYYALDVKGVDRLWEFSKSQRTDLDAWLVFNAHFVNAIACGSDRGIKFLDGKISAFERAAAIEALAAGGCVSVLGVVEKTASAKLTGSGLEQRVILGACAAALAWLREQRQTEGFKAAARAVIALLDNKKVETGLKLTIARNLACAYASEKIWVNAEPWLKVLDAKPDDGGHSVVKRDTTFFGVEGRGKRVVYVIDLSDSMMRKLTPGEIDDIKKRLGPADPKEKNNLPWDKIKTRFDAVREVLKFSLRQLGSDMLFGVVTFGTEARPLNATQKLTAETPQTVGTAISELDNIRPGSAVDGRPDGTLMGDTNLHAGLVRAFRLTNSGLLAVDDEHVNAKAFGGGCDTIFVLSDGAPSCDDYEGNGPLEVNDGTMDHESGKVTAGDGTKGNFPYNGPYADADFLMRDVQRMNLFRKVEINCIGVGESRDDLLENIAREGLGVVVKIGAGGDPKRVAPQPAQKNRKK